MANNVFNIATEWYILQHYALGFHSAIDLFRISILNRCGFYKCAHTHYNWIGNDRNQIKYVLYTWSTFIDTQLPIPNKINASRTQHSHKTGDRFSFFFTYTQQKIASTYLYGLQHVPYNQFQSIFIGLDWFDFDSLVHPHATICWFTLFRIEMFTIAWSTVWEQWTAH